MLNKDKNKIKVSIIIVNYNTRNLTFECIRSIYEFTKDVQFQIIVIDNNSNDNSVEFIEENFPLVDIVKSPSNLGFGRANNLGNNIAKGDFLFFLNSDSRIIENSIKHFHDFFKKYESELKIGALGCILLDENFVMNNYGGRFPTVNTILKQALFNQFIRLIPFRKKVGLIFPKLSLKLKLLFLKNKIPLNLENKNYFKVDQVIGADMFMRKSLFSEFNGFSEDFFMNFEETEFQKRIADSGFSQFILNDTKIIHIGGGSGLNKKKNFQRIVTHQSMHIYLRIHDKKNYLKLLLMQITYLLASFLISQYTFKENIKYTKAMLAFLLNNKIIGINS